MTELFERLITNAKEDIALAQREFSEPDDDWFPFMLMIDGRGNMGMVAIDGAFFENDMTKDLLATTVLPQPVMEFEAKAVAFVSSAWHAVQQRDAPQVRPSQHPDRKEIVFITAVSATDVAMEMADIVRSKDGPPVLGEWIPHTKHEVFNEEDEAPVPGGRFVIALRQALTGQG